MFCEGAMHKSNINFYEESLEVIEDEWMKRFCGMDLKFVLGMVDIFHEVKNRIFVIF